MTRRRVLLVNPRMCPPKAVRMPLSLLHLGAALEGRYDYRIVDGNVDPDARGTVLRELAAGPCALLGITVMPGPQVAPAIEIARAAREAHPEVPIAWGGYFPTMYPEAAINAPYVDYVVRGQGERTLLELLDSGAGIAGIAGITWKDQGEVRHNADRPFEPPDRFPPLPYERVAGDMDRYLRPSFMGTRTAVYQAALGCRYHCTFCGVVSMFNGATRLDTPGRITAALTTLRDRFGATAAQFYDNNFFDREETSVPVLEALARLAMPWWCYARADTLAEFAPATWELIRKSRLRMAYIGAESASDGVLRSMKKGSRVEHTFEAARLCRAHGVVPEFSFVLGGPEDPQGEIEKTFELIKRLKALHPECEVILYFYSPTPQRDLSRLPTLERYGPEGPSLPTTPEEWTEPRWISYVCHQDAPWLTPRTRQRVKDFATVLGCRFPTVQDYRTPAWGKALLSGLARRRYDSGRYDDPWELRLAKRMIPLREPARESV
ncbi:MAG TPA: radical SAM protein [Thermoanaerobaculia bacterium]|nr:radical SAM protein [Thermoanaerobaculia bacterium]